MPPEIFPQRKVFFAFRSGLISGRISGLAGYRISGRAYPVSGRIPDIRQSISSIRPDTGYLKIAGYPAHPYL